MSGTSSQERGPLTPTEARRLAERVRTRLDGARADILELYERRGWEALGYSSWEDCARAEFQQSYSQVQRQLAAAKVERQLIEHQTGSTFSPMAKSAALPGLKLGNLKESHARELGGLEPETSTEVLKRASKGGAATAAKIREAKREVLAELERESFESLPPEKKVERVRKEEQRVERTAAQEEPDRDPIAKAWGKIDVAEIAIPKAVKKLAAEYGKNPAPLLRRFQVAFDLLRGWRPGDASARDGDRAA
jgi:hypothetical protein